MIGPLAVNGALLVSLGLLFFRHIRVSGSSPALSAAAALLLLGQSGLALCAIFDGQGLWLALAVYAISAGALALTARQFDARVIVALGGALGAVQLADPAGGMIAALALPMITSLQRVRLAQSAGLFALLLVIPCIVAVLLAYGASDFHLNPAQLLFRISRSGTIRLPPGRSLASLLFFLPVCPVLVWSRQNSGPRTVLPLAAVALAVSLAALATLFIGIARDPLVFMAALAPVPVFSIGIAEECGARKLLWMASGTTALSWAVALGALVPLPG